MLIEFYKLQSPTNKVGKTLHKIGDTNGNILEGCTHSDISLQVNRQSHQKANYIKIPNLGRAYFIKNHIFNPDGLDVIDCHVDVLESWKESIKDSTQFILRQQNEYNQYLIDSQLPRENDAKIDGYVFGGRQFTLENGGYILVTQGGVE